MDTDMETSDSNCSALQELHIQSETPPYGQAPYLHIAEQPIDKFRFRYKSEMHGTHGSLTGINTNKRRKTFPMVRLVGFSGDATIRCSLYQMNEANKCLHSHSLVVRRDNEDCRDPHDVKVSQNQGYTAIFQGMGIIHTAKKYIVDELMEKLIDRQNFLQNRPCTDLERAKLKFQAESEARTMNLNQVCLCFEAYKLVGNMYEAICEPVLSAPINNMKSALTGELKITRLSTTISDAAGNSDLFLFVEKVGKKNIKVRFFELDEDEHIIWEDFGKFSEADVHHQYAIALRTPEYRDINIEQKVDVFIQLFRPTDNCESAPVPFQYKPRSTTMTRKRARISSANNSSELPAVLCPSLNNALQSMPTISKEYNTYALIEDCLENQMPSSELDMFMKYVNSNSEDMQAIVGSGQIERDSDSTTQLNNANPVQILCNNIRRVAKIESMSNARAYLQNVQRRAQDKRNPHHRRYDLLHIALSDESSETAALDVIHLFNEFDLAYWFNVKNDEMQTPLHLACILDKPLCIAQMLQFGANPNKVDNAGNTPLHLAVSEGAIQCVAALVNQQNYTTKSHPLLIDIFNDYGMTALHLAIRKSNLHILKMVEAAGASLKLCEPKQGDSVLHMAVQQNSEDLVHHLLASAEINVAQRNTSNYTALGLALGANPVQPNIVSMLKEREDDQTPVTNVVNSYKPKPVACDHRPHEFQAAMQHHVVYPKAKHPLFDDICADELCDIFNGNAQWLQLAVAFKCPDHQVAEWREDPNPSSRLLQFIAADQRYELHDVVNVFLELDVSNALSCLDDMIARRMEGAV